MMVEYVDIPVDGDWDTVEFICKPVGSVSSYDSLTLLWYK